MGVSHIDRKKVKCLKTTNRDLIDNGQLKDIDHKENTNMNKLHVVILIGAITFSSGSYLTKRNRRCGSECIRDEHCDQGSVCERTTDACRRYICVKKFLQVPQVIDSVPHIDTVDKLPLRGDVYVNNDKTTPVSSLDLPHPISPLGHSDIVQNGNKPWLIDPNSSTLTKIVNSNVGSDDTINTLTGSKNVDLLQICINNCLMRTTCLQGTDCSLRCKTSCLHELSNINLNPSLPKGSIVPLELGPNGEILQAGTKIEIPGNTKTEFLSVNQQGGINPGQNEMVSSGKPIDSYVSSDSLRHKKEEHPIKLINDYSLTDSSGNKQVVAPVQSVDTYVPNDSTGHKEEVPFVKSIDNYVPNESQDHKVVMNRFTNVITSDKRGGGFVDRNGQVQPIDPVSLEKQTNIYDPKDSTGKKEVPQPNPSLKGDHTVLIDPNFGTITKFETSNGGFVNDMDNLSDQNNAGLLKICIDNCVETSRCLQNDCRLGCQKLCLNELPLINVRPSLPEVQDVFRPQDQMNQIMQVGTGREIVGELNTDMVSVNKETGIQTIRREIVLPGKPIDTYVQKEVVGGRGGDLIHKSQIQQIDNFSPVQPIDDYIPKDLSVNSNVGSDGTVGTLSTSKNIGVLQICIDNCLARITCQQGTDCILRCKNLCLNELLNNEFTPSLPKGIHGDQTILIDPNSGTLTSIFKSPVDQPSPLKPIDAYVQNNLPGHKEVVAPVKSTDTYVQGNLKKQYGVKPVFKPFESTNQNDLPEHTEVVNRLTQVRTSNGQGIGLEHNRHLQPIDNFSPVQPIDDYIPKDLSVNSNVGSDGTVGTLSTSKNVGVLQICIDNCLARILCLQGTDCILRCKNLCLNELQNNELPPLLPKGSIVPFVRGPNSEILHAGENEVLTSNSENKNKTVTSPEIFPLSKT
ncbi:uncharacterized protein LOC127722043 [Mytilus californianus]|uniref:uncharacterized protein LOC127722043 n=1 Tax=Mytilus californianus TaxID=6549 RepID=UPI002247045A|nr:uncharacterized protein LOC127722043 [Mytilus californianus]